VGDWEGERVGFASKDQFSLDSALPAVVSHGSALPCANDKLVLGFAIDVFSG